MATSTASHRPLKGILKNKSSTASNVAASNQQSGGVIPEVKRKKSQKWDELNILATHRPAFRDYDFMKINEPSSPHLGQPDDGEDALTDLEAKEAMPPDMLAKKLAASKIYSQEEEPENDEPHCSKSLFDQQEKEQPFEVKRKLHYNEGMNIKLARQLISKDFDDDEETLPENNEDNTPAEESNEGAATDELQTRSCQV